MVGEPPPQGAVGGVEARLATDCQSPAVTSLPRATLLWAGWSRDTHGAGGVWCRGSRPASARRSLIIVPHTPRQCLPPGSPRAFTPASWGGGGRRLARYRRVMVSGHSKRRCRRHLLSSATDACSTRVCPGGLCVCVCALSLLFARREGVEKAGARLGGWGRACGGGRTGHEGAEVDESCSEGRPPVRSGRASLPVWPPTLPPSGQLSTALPRASWRRRGPPPAGTTTSCGTGMASLLASTWRTRARQSTWSTWSRTLCLPFARWASRPQC